MLVNEYKNVKTIVFSELPKNEKIKYFNFLLENEINFTRDENGYYVALIKVLNPAFYGEDKDSLNPVGHSEKTKSSQLNDGFSVTSKPRSSSQHATSSARSGKDNNKLRAKSPINKKNTTEDKKNTPLQNYSEIFNNKYSKFFKILKPLVGVRGKRININQLKYNIEEIYSIRFIKDTSALRSQLTKSNQAEVDVKDPFPSFVVEFLTNKYVKKPTVDQHSLDLLLSVDYYSKISKEIEIFSKFLNEEYDPDDLIFFLFVRSCIEKETKKMFIEKAREEIKIQYQEEEYDTNLYLNIKTCIKIANTIFGSEEELLLNSFMEKVEKNLVTNSKGKNLIKAISILEITLEDYHQSRKLYSNEGANQTKEKLSSKAEKKKDDQIQRETNLFDEYEEETNEYNQSRRTFNETKEKSSVKDTASFTQVSINSSRTQNDKVTKLKNMISVYINEKEIDVFFNKLMSSYSVYEKDNQKIKLVISNIKDLVTKKLTLLINIIFNRDQQAWIASLKIRGDDMNAIQHYSRLVDKTNEMLLYNNIQEIPMKSVEDFAQCLLSTSELNLQINKLILKHFG